MSLTDLDTRKKLSPVAMKVFGRIAEKWSIPVDGQCLILGGVTKSQYECWQNEEPLVLPPEALERISLVLGIYGGLRTIFNDGSNAIHWLNTANRDLKFEGKKPIDLIKSPDVEDVWTVRRYIDYFSHN